MVHVVKRVVFNKNQTYDTSIRTYVALVRIRWAKLKPLILVDVKSVVETAWWKRTKSMSRNLVEEANCDVFATGYCAAAKSI